MNFTMIVDEYLNDLYYSMFFVQVSDYHYIPDTPKMSDRLRVCLQENDEVKF